MSVTSSFKTLIERLEPLASETKALEGHFTTICTRLKSNFGVSQCLKVGSYSRGTMIRGRSDGDLFVVLTREEVRWGGDWMSSNTVLEKFRRDLKDRFPRSEVYKDVHSIVVGFGSGQVDVVPAFYWDRLPDGWPLYYMPDGSGGWMKSSPGRHNKHLKDADVRSRGQMKNIARLIKFWRECRTPRVPISSFHIEMLLAAEGIGVGVVSYADAVRQTLRLLASRECKGMHDPLKISGTIPCVKTEAQRPTTLATIRHSRNKANEAQAWEGVSEAEAVRYWKMVFNGNFPS